MLMWGMFVAGIGLFILAGILLFVAFIGWALSNLHPLLGVAILVGSGLFIVGCFAYWLSKDYTEDNID